MPLMEQKKSVLSIYKHWYMTVLIFSDTDSQWSSYLHKIFKVVRPTHYIYAI